MSHILAQKPSATHYGQNMKVRSSFFIDFHWILLIFDVFHLHSYVFWFFFMVCIDFGGSWGGDVVFGTALWGVTFY